MTSLSGILPMNILVVEDNYPDYLLLENCINISGLPVETIELAESLEAAKAYLATNKPDLVFLDLYLPDSDGLNSFHDLKAYLSSAVVIILSGSSDNKIALEAIALGAQDYLAKGEFDEKFLNRTIRYGIERRRNLESLRVANERYSLVSKATNDLIWDWDLSTNQVYRDEKSVSEIYGVSDNAGIANLDEWNKRIHPSDFERLTNLIKEIKGPGSKDSFEIEYRFMGDNGDYKHIYDRGFVVRNAQGEAIRLIGAAQDMTEKKKMEKALLDVQTQQRRAIAEATLEGQENEREQLGLELHDNINQILATAQLYIDHALTSPVPPKDIILKSKEMIALATKEIRKLSHALLPPSFDEFGLVQALTELTDTIERTNIFTMEKHWDNFPEFGLQRDQKLTIYRIVQEQLNNIIKHADASKVLIYLRLLDDDNRVELLIKDNGKGFDTTKKRNGVGIRNIISRVELFYGTATIKSKPEHGCELTISFPLVNHFVNSITSIAV